jgi:hypothetical protein
MAVVTKRKTVTIEQQVSIEYKRYLRSGGRNEPKSVQVAAFDRIADKWMKK